MRSMRCLGRTLLILILYSLWLSCEAQVDEIAKEDPVWPDEPVAATPPVTAPETYLQNELIPVVPPSVQPAATTNESEPDGAAVSGDRSGREAKPDGSRPAGLAGVDISDQELEYLMNSGAAADENTPVEEATGMGTESTIATPVEEPSAVTGSLPAESGLAPEDSRLATAGSGVAPETSEAGASIRILGATLAPGEARQLHWVAGETLYGGSLDTPVYVIHGRKPGLRLCVTAAIHGDELNGVEIVRTLMAGISPQDLSGTLIGTPIVNLLGFTRGTRYLPDRRDLNRYFPGNAWGSSASRIAGSFFEEVIRHCDRLVDLHTGSLNRVNLPQLRADLDNPQVLEFIRQFGSTAVLHSRNVRGNLRSAAISAGIPAVTFELGEPGSLQQDQIDYGVRAMETLMDKLDMIHRRRARSSPQPVYYSSRWVRVNNGGLLKSAVKIGSRIRRGTRLGTIINPLTSENYDISSPYNGRVLGMSLDQFMLPGYAAFHIGIASNDTELLLETQTLECGDYEQLYEEIDCTVDLDADDGDPDSLPEDLSPDEMDSGEMDTGEMETGESPSGEVLPDAMEAAESLSGDVLPEEMEAAESPSGEVLPDEIQSEEILSE